MIRMRAVDFDDQVVTGTGKNEPEVRAIVGHALNYLCSAGAAVSFRHREYIIPTGTEASDAGSCDSW